MHQQLTGLRTQRGSRWARPGRSGHSPHPDRNSRVTGSAGTI